MKESSIGFRPKYLLNFVDAVYYVHHIVSMAVLNWLYKGENT